MTTSLLLVSTATRWLGTARIPRSLAKAGFEVALLTPKNSLAENSGYLSSVGHLPDAATVPQFIMAFAGMVRAVSPRLVIPCDDTAFRLLQMLVLSPPENLEPTLRLQLAVLISASLGDPAHYRASVDKTLLPPLAASVGVRVPAYAIVSTLKEMEPFLAARDFPVVLKRGHGFAGQGVVICHERAELAPAMTALQRADGPELGDSSGRRLLLQEHIVGRELFYPAAVWKGELLAGWAADKLISHPAPTGPATVLRYRRDPVARDFVARLVRRMGITGLMGTQFVVQEGTGLPFLLEINRRITPGVHRGTEFGVDLCAALYGALHGAPSTSRADMDEGEDLVNVHFPQEWLRDPDSRYLRDYPVDVPWDEPALVDALLALRHER